MPVRKIVILKGSPRKNGNTAALADRLAEGAEAAGAQVDNFYLHGMDISPCDACDACRTETYTGCIIEDDMQMIYPKLLEADALVIASPVYYFTMSAQTKLFMDRCYALTEGDESLLKGKEVGILMAYEDADPFVSGAVNALRAFQDAYRYIGAEIVGMVYAQAYEAGEILDDEDVMERAFALGQRLGSG